MGEKPSGHGALDLFHHLVRLPSEITVTFGIGDEVLEGLDVGVPIRPEYGVYGETLIAFIVPKYAVPEEFIGQFGSAFVFFFEGFFIELIVDDANPGADARQRPHIKLIVERLAVLCKCFQNPDV